MLADRLTKDMPADYLSARLKDCLRSFTDHPRVAESRQAASRVVKTQERVAEAAHTVDSLSGNAGARKFDSLGWPLPTAVSTREPKKKVLSVRFRSSSSAVVPGFSFRWRFLYAWVTRATSATNRQMFSVQPR